MLGGFAALGLSVALASLGAILRLRRRGRQWVLVLPPLALILHPVHAALMISPPTHGMPLWTGVFGVAVWGGFAFVELNLYRMSAADNRHRKPVVGKLLITFAVLGLVGMSVSVAKYLLPADPPPQRKIISYILGWDTLHMRQDIRARANRLYFRSAAEAYRENPRDDYFARMFAFEQHLDNADPEHPEHREVAHVARILQGTQDKPTAWQLDNGLTEWAFIARPIGFPDHMQLEQFLFTSDGKVWAKPDPRSGEFLLAGAPEDPTKDGWTELDAEVWRE
jgi:hypothetical protein